MNLLSTKEAAERLGVDVSRVRRLILDERLPAEKMGRDWFIKEEDLALLADRKPGRPPSAENTMFENATELSPVRKVRAARKAARRKPSTKSQKS